MDKNKHGLLISFLTVIGSTCALAGNSSPMTPGNDRKVIPNYGCSLYAGQNMLTDDNIVRFDVCFQKPTSNGQNSLWNFSKAKCKKDQKSKVIIENKADGKVFDVTSGSQTDHFKASGDTLYLLGFQSPLKSFAYNEANARLKFPFSYGDSIGTSFTGYGDYCGSHPFKEQGSTMVKADAEGVIVLPGNDTLRNVLRVYTIKSYSIGMDIRREALDTAKLKQVIEEKYQWYANGYRYPVMETVVSTSYANMNALGSTKNSYSYLPDADKVFGEETEEEMLAQDSQANVDDLSNGTSVDATEQDIIHYSVETNGSLVNITYDLDADATISTIVASHMGMIYRQNSWTQSAGQGYSTKINCAGLRHGTYILYINVNGKVYSEKVTL